MYDLHNHILPGIDDGPQTLKESLLMARQASAQGTRVMAATPHRFHSGNENIGMEIVRKVAELQSHFDAEEIDLRLIAGVEMTMRDDIVSQLKSGRMIPLGGPGGKTVLIEPPFDQIPQAALALLQSVADAGYTPILAHPERNKEIQAGSNFPAQCAQIGAVLQITAGSVLGDFGHKAQSAARSIAERPDWRVIIASDAHWAYERTPGDLNRAMRKVAEWTGSKERALEMVESTPRALVE